MAFSNILVFSVLVSIGTLRNELFINAMNSGEERQRQHRLETLFSSYEPCADAFDCPGNEECREGTCVDVCINHCLGPHQNCYGLNYQARCGCKYGYSPNSDGICELSCTDSSNCSNLEECVQAEDGSNKCQCRLTYNRDLYKPDKCELSHTCHDNNACQKFEICINNECIASCSNITCSREHEHCLAANHQAICTCMIGYGRNPFGKCEKECDDTTNCGSNARCSAIGYSHFCNCIPGYVIDRNHVCRKVCIVDSDCDNGHWCNLYLCNRL